jgi:SH3-like domain-containing protein
MLDALQQPIVIAIVVLILLVLIVIPVLLRRRRAAREEVLPPPELGQAIDYTSLPYEEPTSLGDRFRQASPAVKLLAFLVPLVIIVAGVVLWFTFLRDSGGGVAESTTPTPPPAMITDVAAVLTGPTKIKIDAQTTLPENTTVTAMIKEGEQELVWYNKDKASAQVSGGKISLTLDKAKSAAPTPKRGTDQVIILVGQVDGQTITSEPVKLRVPPGLQAEFYRDPSAVAPTAVPTAMPSPPPVQTTAPAAASPTPAEPTVPPASQLTATVFNGGNIRKEPRVTQNQGDILGQLHADEVVTLLERTADSAWYRVKAPEAEGWVSATLLTIEPAIAKQVPTAQPQDTGLTARVFNGGNVRERPVTGKPVDQVNAGETVKLLAKTADAGWYQITTIRGLTGWVSRTLLTIDPAVAKQVPVAK